MKNDAKMIEALFIPVEGEMKKIQVDVKDYKSYQKIVGGTYDAYPLKLGTLIVCDDGRLLNMKRNIRAGQLFGSDIVGDVMVVGPIRGSADTSITPKIEEWVKNTLATASTPRPFNPEIDPAFTIVSVGDDGKMEKDEIYLDRKLTSFLGKQ